MAGGLHDYHPASQHGTLPGTCTVLPATPPSAQGWSRAGRATVLEVSAVCWGPRSLNCL